MSPDIEWQVDGSTGQETIVKTTKPPRDRRRKIAMFFMVLFGIGLGLLYHSIPDPLVRPAPEPTQTAQPTLSVRPTPGARPETLDEAIQRDVNVLATSANESDPSLAFAASPNLEYADWYRSLQSVSGRWGIVPSFSLFSISETGTLPSGVVWVNIRQSRNHDYFYQTRFYRQQDNRWGWTLPDPSFWSGKTTTISNHIMPWSYPFRVIYPVEDEAIIQVAIDRFVRTMALLCSDLNCPVRQDAERQGTYGITLTLVIDPGAQHSRGFSEQAGNITVTLPSPRIAGYYQDIRTAGDPLTAMAFDALLEPSVRLATGNYDRWSSDHSGELFLQAIMDWQRERVRAVLKPPAFLFKDPVNVAAFPTGLNGQSVAQLYARQLRTEERVPLVSVWDWWRNGSMFGSLLDSAHTEAESVIAFIAERLGGDRVIPFLNALGSAQSVDQAFENGLGMTFGDFYRQWLPWIGQD